MTPVLAAERVTVRIGTKTLLDDVSLAFTTGETVAIVGPNGAGKTTLLRVLSGELAARPGQVLLKGRPLAQHTPRELARHRAVLSQSIQLAFPFTVAETVRMGAADWPKRNADALIAQALAEVDLRDFPERITTTLSGGEQQRVHFARVLAQPTCGEAVHGPGVLLLDEPTASLDLKHQIDLLTLAKRRAARGTLVIAILHDLNLAALFADRVVVMKAGRVDCDGAPTHAITTDMLARVFDLSTAVGRVPPAGVPFVLPQAYTADAAG
jgi:iron complex transport system ATP-binding protein